jgi:Zn-dependent peptidase ImmA (M78 family)
MKKSWKSLRLNIPSKIQIKPKVAYEVLWIDNFSSDKEGEITHGETRYEARQIVLNNNEKPKDSVHTYWHEFLHATGHEYEANLTEKQVRALEKSFNAFREFFATLEGKE